jgi:hypothetical protein
VNWHRIKLVAAALVPALLYASWKSSHYLFESLHCVGSLKGAQPCERFGLNVTPILSAVAGWGMLLWLPALAIAVLVFGEELWLRFRMPKQ